MYLPSSDLGILILGFQGLLFPEIKMAPKVEWMSTLQTTCLWRWFRFWWDLELWYCCQVLKVSLQLLVIELESTFRKVNGSLGYGLVSGWAATVLPPLLYTHTYTRSNNSPPRWSFCIQIQPEQGLSSCKTPFQSSAHLPSVGPLEAIVAHVRAMR